MRRLLPLAFALAPLTGCIVIEIPGDLDFDSDLESDWQDERADEPDVWTEGASLRGRGRVRGDLGSVRGFDASTEDVQGSSDAWWTSVTVTAWDDDGRMGMIIVELDGDVRALPSGAYRYSASGVDGPGSVSGLYVTGCSSGSDTSYDAPSQDGVIVVDNDGDDCDVDVEAELPADDGSVTIATATFTIE